MTIIMIGLIYKTDRQERELVSSKELTHDPLRATSELREQLSLHTRRLGFFLGSGTSMAVGLPGVEQLTRNVASELDGVHRQKYDELLQGCGQKATVEDVLNKV